MLSKYRGSYTMWWSGKATRFFSFSDLSIRMQNFEGACLLRSADSTKEIGTGNTTAVAFPPPPKDVQVPVEWKVYLLDED